LNGCKKCAAAAIAASVYSSASISFANIQTSSGLALRDRGTQQCLRSQRMHLSARLQARAALRKYLQLALSRRFCNQGNENWGYSVARILISHYSACLKQRL